MNLKLHDMDKVAKYSLVFINQEDKTQVERQVCLIDDLEKAEIKDATEEVAEWIEEYGEVLCTKCRQDAKCNWRGEPDYSLFCPTCGARMKNGVRFI